MKKPKSKKEAILVSVQINESLKGLFDLMMPATEPDVSHCNTCNCSSYNTYTGYSIKPDSGEGYLLNGSTHRDLQKWCLNNLDKIVKG